MHHLPPVALGEETTTLQDLPRLYEDVPSHKDGYDEKSSDIDT